MGAKRKKKRPITNPWPVNKELMDHMAMRQEQHRKRGMTAAEKWFFETVLLKTNFRWGFQARWGFRLFDFWNHKLGMAVEVDGPEHNLEADLLRDKREWERSRIVVFRVRNWNRADAESFQGFVEKTPTWNARRLEAKMKLINNAGEIA